MGYTYSPEAKRLLDGIRTEAARMSKNWALPASFGKLWIGESPKGIQIQFFRSKLNRYRGWLPTWVTVMQPFDVFEGKEYATDLRIEVTNSDHRSVVMPDGTPPAKVLAKLWQMQKPLLDEEPMKKALYAGDLRDKVIRLAHEVPETRKHLLPLLRQAAVEEDPNILYRVYGADPTDTFERPMDFRSLDKLLRAFRQTGTVTSGPPQLRGLPKLKDLMGPTFDGKHQGITIIRYDAVY